MVIAPYLEKVRMDKRMVLIVVCIIQNYGGNNFSDAIMQFKYAHLYKTELHFDFSARNTWRASICRNNSMHASHEEEKEELYSVQITLL